MIVESAIGKVTIAATELNVTSNVAVESDSEQTLRSILDLLELIGGAENEDVEFSDDAIESLQRFGKTVYRTYLSRTQASRWFTGELLNYVDYTSLAKMRKL